MPVEVIKEILLPLMGTALGASCVFFMRGTLHTKVQRTLTGFAAGVMVAASIWSLLVPAMEQAENMGQWAFLPAVIGFWLGILFLQVLDRTIPHLHQNSIQPEGPHTRLKRTTMLVLAVTLHNIPEGMAVGVVLAGWMAGNSGITAAGTLALSLGIAIQNFPEGAIISMPLRAEGAGKGRAFLYGVLSGIVEPLAAILTMLMAGLILPALPYLLSFAAGAMIYVVVEELIPPRKRKKDAGDAGHQFKRDDRRAACVVSCRRVCQRRRCAGFGGIFSPRAVYAGTYGRRLLLLYRKRTGGFCRGYAVLLFGGQDGFSGRKRVCAAAFDPGEVTGASGTDERISGAQ